MAKEKMDIKLKKCKTPEFRVSFPQVFEPKSFQGQEPKFSMVMLFKKGTDLKELQRAVHNAATEEWGADYKKKVPGLRMPFKSGDAKPDLKGYPGSIVVSASSKQMPQVVDQAVQPITKADIAADGQPRFYAGCYARATLIAFAYDKAGNKGVSFSLQNIQKLRDGERFAGKPQASEEFEAVADVSDDASQYGEVVDEAGGEYAEAGF